MLSFLAVKQEIVYSRLVPGTLTQFLLGLYGILGERAERMETIHHLQIYWRLVKRKPVAGVHAGMCSYYDTLHIERRE